MQVYLDRETYDKLIAALLAIETDSFLDRSDAIKITLGEVGDIWPADLVEDHHQLDDSGVEFIEDGGAPSSAA